MFPVMEIIRCGVIFCKCYFKTNIKCANCDKPFSILTTKQQQIEELKKKISSNQCDNVGYKMEIRDLEYEINEEEKKINYNILSDPNVIIEHCNNNSDDEYTTKSEDISSTDSE